MFTDADTNEDTKSASLLADVTDDSCRFEYIEIVPLARDTDGSCTTDCDSGDWSAQVKQENLTVVKQEPEDDDTTNASCCTTNDAEHDEVDETPSHMQPDVVLERLSLARMKNEYSVTIGGSCFNDEMSTSQRENHTRKQLCSCSQCGKCFWSQDGLRLHMNIHTGKHECTECGMLCASSSGLTVHKRSHSGQKPYKCHLCDKAYSVSGNLNRHLRVHTGDKPYKCSMCDKAFGRIERLNTHMRVHTADRPYECSLCNKSFKSSNYLRVHLTLVHSITRPYRRTAPKVDESNTLVFTLVSSDTVQNASVATPIQCTSAEVKQ